MSAYGFSVVLTPSYLQVAKFEDRYILRDGYHRSFGLLARGITHVPAFVRDFESMEQLGLPPGLLPQTAYLGERPPVLTDYSDDAVAADVQVPSTQKVIAIQALEYTVMS